MPLSKTVMRAQWSVELVILGLIFPFSMRASGFEPKLSKLHVLYIGANKVLLCLS